MTRKQWLVGVLVCGLFACGNPAPSPSSQQAAATPEALVAQSEPVTPPFAVRDDAEGLLMVWYDAQGAAHTAAARADIPEDRRTHVRVDSLNVAPEQRLDPAYVYVADLRSPGSDGSYPVHKLLREAFEASLTPAAAAPEAELAHADGNDVIIYGASWCGACRSAAGYLRQKGVPFVEKDIEKEPGARSEMLSKAKAQGVSTGGIPVIDVYGTLLQGFDPQRIERLLANHKGT